MQNRSLLRTLIPLILIGVFAAAPSSVEAQVRIGAGLGWSELSDVDMGNSDGTFEGASGWHVHLAVDLPLGPVALRPGIRYIRAGELFEDATFDNLPTEFDDEPASMIEIPIDLRFRLPFPLISPYLMTGPVLRFPDDDDRFDSFSLAGGVGVGLEIGLGALTFSPELNYTFGITRFTEETYEIGGVTITPDEDQTLNAVMLSLGIGL